MPLEQIKQTLEAIALDLEVMDQVIKIAYDNISEGISIADKGMLIEAQHKVESVCDVLEKTAVLFTLVLNKHKAAISPKSTHLN